MNSPVVRKLAPAKWLVGSLILLAGLVFMFTVVSRVSAVPPTDNPSGHLLTIHDRGVDSVVLSQANTLGEALAEAGIVLDSKDAVEPSRDEALVASEYEVNIYRARPVLVIDGTTKQKVVTAYQTPAQIAASVGIKLYPEDEATIARSSDLLGDGAGLVMTIDRATEIKFNQYGKTITMRTQAERVGQLLTEKGIFPGKNDGVSPSLATDITPGMTVRVWREGKQTVTVTEDVKFDVEEIQDGDRELGYRSIKTPGKNGKATVTYELVVKKGKIVKRTKIASVQISAPKTQVEVVGAKVFLSLPGNYAANKVAIMTAAGVADADQGYAAYIIDNENALWCPIRWQGTTGCADAYYEKFPGAESSSQVGYGLCQATPANKMATAGADWRTNAITQMKWCHSYAVGRYGSWAAAYRFKTDNGWW